MTRARRSAGDLKKLTMLPVRSRFLNASSLIPPSPNSTWSMVIGWSLSITKIRRGILRSTARLYSISVTEIACPAGT